MVRDVTGPNRLERAVPPAIARQYPDDEAALLLQLDAATPVGRRNTGAGFLGDLAVDPARVRPVGLRSPVGEIRAEIAGFRDAMGLLLFLEDGMAAMPEGHALRDGTAGTDFGAVSFALLGPGPTPPGETAA